MHMTYQFINISKKNEIDQIHVNKIMCGTGVNIFIKSLYLLGMPGSSWLRNE